MHTALLHREAFTMSLHLVLQLMSAVRFFGLGRVTSSDSGSLVEPCRCVGAVPPVAILRDPVTASDSACKGLLMQEFQCSRSLQPPTLSVAMQISIPASCWEPLAASPYQLPRPGYRQWGDGEDLPFASQTLRCRS